MQKNIIIKELEILNCKDIKEVYDYLIKDNSNK